MSRRPITADDLDEYQRTVLAGRIAWREVQVGYRLSSAQRRNELQAYLAELNAEAPTVSRHKVSSQKVVPSFADYHWRRPVPFRRGR